MMNHQRYQLCTIRLVILLVATLIVKQAAAAKYIPKWKKQVGILAIIHFCLMYIVLLSHFNQACEIPASQNEHSHYICDDDGDVKCLPGWQGDLCDVPICRKGCDPQQGNLFSP